MSLGNNIKQLRAMKSWSTHRLADEAGVPQSSISRFESDAIRPRRSTLEKVARALGVEAAFLEYGTADVFTVPPGKRRIPVIDYVQAGTWSTVAGELDEENHHEYILTEADYSADTFALTVKGESMLPDFRPGDILTIDPSIAARPGDFVIAADRDGEAVFKQLAHVRTNEAGKDVFELRSLNPLYPTWNSETTQFRVVGTMVEFTRRYRFRKPSPPDVVQYEKEMLNRNLDVLLGSQNLTKTKSAKK